MRENIGLFHGKMKSVLISIRPKWCEKIANGEKTIEVRKTLPKLAPPFKCYIYCTVGGIKKMPRDYLAERFARGKVIGEFVCDFILDMYPPFGNKTESACLEAREMYEYAAGKQLYGWHISDLVIYNKPKELSEFWNADKCPYASKDGCTYGYHCYRAGQTKRCGSTLTKPPQSWCYAEEGAGNG